MKHVVELVGSPTLWPRPISWDLGARVVSHTFRCLVCGTRSRFFGHTPWVDVEQLSDCPGLSDEMAGPAGRTAKGGDAGVMAAFLARAQDGKPLDHQRQNRPPRPTLTLGDRWHLNLPPTGLFQLRPALGGWQYRTRPHGLDSWRPWEFRFGSQARVRAGVQAALGPGYREVQRP